MSLIHTYGEKRDIFSQSSELRAFGVNDKKSFMIWNRVIFFISLSPLFSPFYPKNLYCSYVIGLFSLFSLSSLPYFFLS